jgi:hypothetical protein
MPVDIAQLGSLVASAVMFGLLIWLGLKIKDWTMDDSTRPKWLLSIIVAFNPVKYNKITGSVPNPKSNVLFVTDSSSTTAKKCASNCSTTLNCTGFTFTSNNCTMLMGDLGRAMMVPKADWDTYFRQDKNSPKYGFIQQTGDYAFSTSSNVIGQRLGSMMTEVDTYILANTCITQSSSNCVGFSYTTVDPKQSWLVNNTSNIESTANVMSYSLDLLGTSDWSETTF